MLGHHVLCMHHAHAPGRQGQGCALCWPLLPSVMDTHGTARRQDSGARSTGQSRLVWHDSCNWVKGAHRPQRLRRSFWIELVSSEEGQEGRSKEHTWPVMLSHPSLLLGHHYSHWQRRPRWHPRRRGKERTLSSVLADWEAENRTMVKHASVRKRSTGSQTGQLFHHAFQK